MISKHVKGRWCSRKKRLGLEHLLWVQILNFSICPKLCVKMLDENICHKYTIYILQQTWFCSCFGGSLELPKRFCTASCILWRRYGRCTVESHPTYFKLLKLWVSLPYRVVLHLGAVWNPVRSVRKSDKFQVPLRGRFPYSLTYILLHIFSSNTDSHTSHKNPRRQTLQWKLMSFWLYFLRISKNVSSRNGQ